MSEELHARDAAVSKIAEDLAAARAFMKVAVILCVAVILVAAVLGAVVVRVAHNAQQIDNLQALCRTRPLFDFMINAPSETPRTPAQEELVRQFRVIIDTAYAECPTSTSTATITT